MKSPPRSLPADLRKLVSTLLGRTVRTLRAVGGGRNSRVYRIEAPPAPPLAAKFFAESRRPRAAVEFEGLRFLWKLGERSIPRPVSLHAGHSCAIYEFVEGRPVPPE